MRILGTMLSVTFLLAYMVTSGWTQCPAGGCPNGACCPPPIPRYPGYGVSSSNYYLAPPPHILGGPAYGYSFPYPYCNYCANPGKNYIAPAYPSNYYYPYARAYPYPQSQSSYYSPYAHFAQYPPQSQGSAFATEPTRPAVNVARTSNAAPAPKAPAKTRTARSKHPDVLPDAAPAKKDAAKKKQPDSSQDDAAKRPFLRRLLFWQN